MTSELPVGQVAHLELAHVAKSWPRELGADLVLSIVRRNEIEASRCLARYTESSFCAWRSERRKLRIPLE